YGRKITENRSDFYWWRSEQLSSLCHATRISLRLTEAERFLYESAYKRAEQRRSTKTHCCPSDRRLHGNRIGAPCPVALRTDGRRPAHPGRHLVARAPAARARCLAVVRRRPGDVRVVR